MILYSGVLSGGKACLFKRIVLKTGIGYCMQNMEALEQEFSILREYAAGTISADASFQSIYDLYAPAVRNWTRFAADASTADDLFQDTWLVFYNRWRGWSFQETADEPTGRPVLSFLYRTVQLVLRGYRRKHQREREPLENVELSNGHSHSRKMQASLELGQMLEKAKSSCPPDELDVLMAKLAGLQGAEIAAALGTTPAAVDHRFRSAIARLQKQAGVSKRRRIHHGE